MFNMLNSSQSVIRGHSTRTA